MKVKNYVLVPGAWLGSWVWSRMIPFLENDYNRIYPVTLTGMADRVHLISEKIGIETAITDVLNLIKFNDLDNIVLVGHSFAGKVVASVADRIPEKIWSIIYLDAFTPKKERTPQGSFDLSEFGPLPSDSLGIPLNDAIIDNIGRDIHGPDREWLLSKATPWPIKYATEPISLSEKFDGLRSSYIFCTLTGDPVDEIISGKWGKLDGPYKKIETGHWPMITKPKETAKDILELTPNL